MGKLASEKVEKLAARLGWEREKSLKGLGKVGSKAPDAKEGTAAIECADGTFVGDGGVDAGRGKRGSVERAAVSRRSTSDWWSLAYMAYNEPGGYQYRTVVQVLEKHVECMLDGCAGANHVTEEFLVGMLNRAAELGIRASHPARRCP
ncbi:hypothetical protein AK812_SmicGene30954 [Symbiodinium microadriaticum]|uniref:Uncharacterized protein n=1 Tax=Symbiodinium microadriaticum TaxID=2951 RepID=A0A1Q9CY08_SYMMI|nr:hypothetical protein AK812_SmicGene30954 [Symbiodinium microadriaticum]